MNEGMMVQGPGSDEYETPRWLFDALDAEFGFDFDAAANEGNALCTQWTGNIKATFATWNTGWRIFCNPPYSNIQLFVDSLLPVPNVSVLLLPVRTDSDWFHALQRDPRVTLRFFRKRIAFCLDGKPAGSPRFASLVAVIR